jgi:hypothetical protein
MALTSSPIGTAYTKFQVVTFTTDLMGKKKINFGDGNFEIFEGSTVEHIYNNNDTYTACVKLCSDSEFNDIDNCVVITTSHFVGEVLNVTEALSAYASEESGLFEVSLSSSCPPPIEVGLFVDNTISEYSASQTNCRPRHYFFMSGEPLDSTVVTLENPSVIKVDDTIVGYHDKFCFGYYDDYSGDFDITVKLLGECGLCNSDAVSVFSGVE